MIPVRLALKDFLSYGDPDPIDFTAFDVACLTGDNGVGKSAFLDAIVWSLFGAARGCENGQNQDRLIRDGADETTVDFTFALGEATYRIVRRRSRARGDVRFLIRDGDDWTNIAGETMRETEHRIASTLRMDYDTFTASAFFVQGRAEDFLSRMKPEDRKEVFASLLDLGVYERLEDAARSKAKDADTRRTAYARRIEELGAAAFGIAALKDELDEARRRTTAMQVEVSQCQKDVAIARDELSALRSIEATADGEAKLIVSLEANHERADGLLRSKRTEIETLDALITRTDEVREAYEELERLRIEDERVRECEREAATLREREAELRERIKSEHDAALRRIDEAGKAAASLLKERSILEQAERDLAQAMSEVEAVRAAPLAFEDARQQLGTFHANEARTLEAITRVDARREEIEELASILGRGGGECPVCGSGLDAQHRKQAASRLRADLRSLSTERDSLTGDLDITRKQATLCTEEVERLRKTVTERERLTATVDALRARLERLPVVTADLERLDAERDTDAQRIADGLVAPAFEAELTAVSTKRSGMYDADAHKQLHEHIESLRPSEAMWLRITTAAEQRPSLARQIDEAENHLREIDSQIDERRAAIEALNERLTKLPDATEALRLADEAQKALTAALHLAVSGMATLEERLAAAERTERELEAARKEELEAAAEHRRYRHLVEAFGRGGIPDLVIDNVRPELEDEANDVLGRLTDYEMDVRFVMKRATKAGKERDTFDVLVHHGGGVPRDFAMFSGGEAFRIAFAVRLAMSKLLVRRAGAQLETLVIDEGFGTQDPEGRERLVEAINLARREFGKVLVITHLDDLKDAFETQIRVTKDERRGSVLEVVGA